MGASTARQHGFTIIELMVTIAILGIMATLAAPSFRDTILSARVRSSASDLFDSVLLARSEAVKRNAVIEVVPSASGWAGGWSVKRQSDGLVLQSREALDSINVTASASGNLTFNLDGRVTSNLRQIALYSASSTVVRARCINIDAAGRATIRTDNDTDPTNGCF